MRHRRHEQGIAVRCRVRGDAGGQGTAGTGAIFHDERLTEFLRKCLRERPGDNIGRTSGRERNHQRHGLARPHLRQGAGGRERQDAQGSEQTNNNVHWALLQDRRDAVSRCASCANAIHDRASGRHGMIAMRRRILH
jgi:hypothetical protein